MKNNKDIFKTPQIKDSQINNNYRNNEIGADILNHQSSQSSLKNIPRKKLKFFYTLITGIFLIIVFQLLNLQVIQGQEYRQRAENNRIKNEVISSPRGVIYDRQNKILVKNSPNFTLYFIPSDLSVETYQQKKIADKLSENIDLESEEILELFKNADPLSSQPVIIKEYIDYNKALKLKILLEETPSVKLETQAVRDYQKGPAFSHLLGYIGKITEKELNEYNDYRILDYIGKMGLEKEYESQLKGEDGIRQVERDNFNKIKNIIATKEAIPGNNLVLSIDSDLQQTLYEKLESVIKNQQATGGAVVAMDPQNGEVLAFLSSPSFDNNLFFKGIDQKTYQDLINNPNKPFISRPVSGEYPPGSTIKPVIASAILEEGVADRYDTVNSTGGIKISRWFYPDWKAGGHGITNVVKAIAQSVNTYFYIYGGGYDDVKGLGLELINKYLREFNLGSILGLDYPNEKDGFLPSRIWKKETKGEKWYIGDTYHLAIGQGDILVTPLQVASYTLAIANHGTLYKPHLVQTLTDTDNKIVKKYNSEILNKEFIKKKHIDTVREGMREAVLSGSARALSSLPFSAAGKTGTAQYAQNKPTHAWFTCFAPYENPEIVITVLVENGGEGHAAALPVARAGLETYLSEK